MELQIRIDFVTLRGSAASSKDAIQATEPLAERGRQLYHHPDDDASSESSR